jgi:hypothetical protein
MTFVSFKENIHHETQYGHYCTVHIFMFLTPLFSVMSCSAIWYWYSKFISLRLIFVKNGKIALQL